MDCRRCWMHRLRQRPRSGRHRHARSTLPLSPALRPPAATRRRHASCHDTPRCPARALERNTDGHRIESDHRGRRGSSMPSPCVGRRTSPRFGGLDALVSVVVSVFPVLVVVVLVVFVFVLLMPGLDVDLSRRWRRADVAGRRGTRSDDERDGTCRNARKVLHADLFAQMRATSVPSSRPTPAVCDWKSPFLQTTALDVSVDSRSGIRRTVPEGRRSFGRGQGQERSQRSVLFRSAEIDEIAPLLLDRQTAEVSRL